MIDIHVHILPSLDDGSADMDNSLAMAEIASNDGISALVATPHVMSGAFDNSKDDILNKVDEVNAMLKESGSSVTVLPGAEYYLDLELPEQLARGEILTLNDAGRYLLVELPSSSVPVYTAQVLYEIQLQGVVPIIAHPERNAGFIQDPKLLRDFVQKGVLAQLTSVSITGLFGREVRKTALSFIEAGLVQVIASDAHSVNGRAPLLSQAAAEVERLYGPELALALVKNNPQRIIDGLPLEPMPVIRKRGLWERLFR
jgi:protein-tyrosine phosphatase